MVQAAPLLVAPQDLGPALALGLVPGPLVRLLPPLPLALTPGLLWAQALPCMRGICKQSRCKLSVTTFCCNAPQGSRPESRAVR